MLKVLCNQKSVYKSDDLKFVDIQMLEYLLTVTCWQILHILHLQTNFDSIFEPKND